MLSGKTLMITGGTGSFGNAMVERLLETDIGEIRIFSRSQEKQEEMRRVFLTKMPGVANKLCFFAGDICDSSAVRRAMHGVDVVFHAAAIKQVPDCERRPADAVRTNVLGTESVLTAAIEAGVKKVVCLSTDKAADPVNVMGYSKALMEKVVVTKGRTASATTICCTRYGNVLCTQGSVIPLWIGQIRSGRPVTLTEPRMTRFIMTMDEALDLVLFALAHGETGDVFVQKAPACSMGTQAEALCELFGGKREDIKVVGIRPGERMFEALLTNEECACAIDMGNFYRVPCDRSVQSNVLAEFTSDSAYQFTREEIKAKLASLPYVQEELAK